MAYEMTEQEKFLVAKMVARVSQLHRENRVFEAKLNDPNLSDKDYDLYQGLMDKNIGEQAAMRRMADYLMEWRQNENAGKSGQQQNVDTIASTPEWAQSADNAMVATEQRAG